MDNATTRRSINLPDGTIHYREAGPQAGPAVVLVHGFLVDDGLWGELPEQLAARGFRVLAPTWPLGAHRTAMSSTADLTPRGVARLVASFLEVLGLDEATLVGNDTGGAICQLVLDEDPSRVARLVLTDCDAFETFPPRMFVPLFVAARHPWLLRAALAATRSAWVRNGPLGFGGLVRRRLTAEESLPWVTPYLDDPDVRRDLAVFARGWSPDMLAGSASWLAAYDRPVLLCWAPADSFFTIALGRRLEQTFADARLVEIPDARTFVPLDQPARLAEEIASFAQYDFPSADR